jgi:hypothetical protein
MIFHHVSVAFVATVSLLVTIGCAGVNTTPGNQRGVTSETQATTPTTNTAAPDNSPRVFIPVTGGAPVVGIPIGGGLYLPVTGGAPIPSAQLGPRLHCLSLFLFFSLPRLRSAPRCRRGRLPSFVRLLKCPSSITQNQWQKAIKRICLSAY